MPRPKKKRLCRKWRGDRVFKPRSIPMSDLETIELELGELEAMRLCDLDMLEQDVAGHAMGVSRGTIQRLLRSGRAKTLSAILESKALIIRKGENDEDLHSDKN